MVRGFQIQRRFSRMLGVGIVFLGMGLWSGALAGAPVLGTPATCQNAARLAAHETGVPYDVLMAIALTETARGTGAQVHAWPWTVNMEGAGSWFEDRDAALRYVYRHYKAGARSFDLGCFQVNFKWHGDAFASIEDMFEPRQNAIYAAQFLKTLYAESRDWDLAAGAYHSRTETYARTYRARFKSYRNSVQQTQISPPRKPEHPNPFPLMQRRLGSGRLGSLVPAEAGNAQRLIALPPDSEVAG